MLLAHWICIKREENSPQTIETSMHATNKMHIQHTCACVIYLYNTCRIRFPDHMFRMPDDNINCRHSASTDDVVYCLVADIAVDALLSVCVSSARVFRLFTAISQATTFLFLWVRFLFSLNCVMFLFHEADLCRSLDAECVTYGATRCMTFTMMYLVFICSDILFSIA